MAFQPPVHRIGVSVQLILEALKDAANRRGTLDELRLATGLSEKAAKAAVYKLIHRRIIQVVGLKPRIKARSAPVYGLIRRTS